jgi:hypothetical protein
LFHTTRSLGGAAGLPTAALLPACLEDQLGVCAWIVSDRSWHRVPVRNAPPTAAAELFAAPAVNRTEAFWAGELGLLFARSVDGVITCEYRPWPEDFKPMLGLRPVLSPNGVFHQLGRDANNQQVFMALVPPGAVWQRQPFGRYSISCGAISFADSKRFREPWEARRFDYLIDPNEFIAPVLQFEREQSVIAVCSPRTGLYNFIETAAKSVSPVECRLAFAAESRKPQELGMTVNARTPWDIVPFVFRSSLFIYDRPQNRCFCWQLDQA